MTPGTAEHTMQRTSVTIKARHLKSKFACCAYLITLHSNLGPDRARSGLQKMSFPKGFPRANSGGKDSLSNTQV